MCNIMLIYNNFPRYIIASENVNFGKKISDIQIISVEGADATSKIENFNFPP